MEKLPGEQALLRAVALTTTGERLGLVVGVHHTPDSSEPGWVWVRTGVTAADLSLIPLSNARYGNGSLVIPTTAAAVEGAPQHTAGTSLSPEQEQELREHYELTAQPVDHHSWPEATAATEASEDEQRPLRDSTSGGTSLPTAATGQLPGAQRPQLQKNRITDFETPHKTPTETAGKKDLFIEGIEVIFRQLNLLVKRFR